MVGRPLLPSLFGENKGELVGCGEENKRFVGWALAE